MAVAQLFGAADVVLEREASEIVDKIGAERHREALHAVGELPRAEEEIWVAERAVEGRQAVGAGQRERGGVEARREGELRGRQDGGGGGRGEGGGEGGGGGEEGVAACGVGDHGGGDCGATSGAAIGARVRLCGRGRSEVERHDELIHAIERSAQTTRRKTRLKQLLVLSMGKTDDETVCSFCGMSHLMYKEMRTKDKRIAELEKRLAGTEPSAERGGGQEHGGVEQHYAQLKQMQESCAEQLAGLTDAQRKLAASEAEAAVCGWSSA